MYEQCSISDAAADAASPPSSTSYCLQQTEAVCRVFASKSE